MESDPPSPRSRVSEQRKEAALGIPTADFRPAISSGQEERSLWFPCRAVPVGPMVRTASGEETVCREFFGGGGLLTEAWRKHGLPVMPPVETFPSGQAFRGDHDLRTPWVLKRELWRARCGCYRRVHLMPPMGTFGPWPDWGRALVPRPRRKEEGESPGRRKRIYC